MALAVAIRFDFVDDKGKTSFTKIRVPTGYTIPKYVEAAQGLAQLIANTSDCTITNVSLTFSIDLSGLGLNTIASGLSDVFQKARFQFNTVVAGFRAFFRLPAISETKVVAGSDVINTADAAVAALITAIEDGIVVTGGTVVPCDKYSNDITALSFAKEVFRKSN